MVIPILLLLVATGAASRAASPWTSRCAFRIIAHVELRSAQCSQTPATLQYDFADFVKFDPDTVEVVPLNGASGERVPHRVETFYSSSLVKFHFVVPNRRCTNFAIYFDNAGSGRGRPRRYAGLVGDGDYFREEFARREIAPSHFDCLAD